MRTFSAIDPRNASGTGLALQEPANTSSTEPPLKPYWGFARDTRAALLVCMRAGDIVIVVSTGILSYLIRGVMLNDSLSIPAPYWADIIVGCLILALVMQIAGTYRFAGLHRHQDHLVRVTGCWAAVVFLLIAIIYLSKLADEFSRIWVLVWAVTGWLGLIAARVLAWRAMRWLRARGKLVTYIAVVGHGAAAERCAQRLEADGHGDVRVIGLFKPEVVPRDLLGAHSCRDLGELVQMAADMWIDEIVFAPGNGLADLGSALGELSTLAVDVKVYLDFSALTPFGYSPCISVPIWERPLAGLPAVIKRSMDICLSAMMLIFTLPLMALIAVLIKLDSAGPVLFRQERFGFSKKPFTLYKFRSMRWEAGDDPSALQAQRYDPRVTRVGGFLRRTSLDELPQFLNVLKGDMSLVGPRPHPTPLDEKYLPLIDGYLARHHVKPGITGWAQVNGLRGETDTLEKMERRVEHDLYYISHWWSPLFDLQILGRTLAVFLGQQNAY